MPRESVDDDESYGPCIYQMAKHLSRKGEMQEPKAVCFVSSFALTTALSPRPVPGSLQATEVVVGLRQTLVEAVTDPPERTAGAEIHP